MKDGQHSGTYWQKYMMLLDCLFFQIRCPSDVPLYVVACSPFIQMFSFLRYILMFEQRLFNFSNQQTSESSERLTGLSDDVGAGFISGHSTQATPAAELNVERSVELPPSDEMGSMGLSKVIRADQKRFFFDLGSNNRGHFLRISEVAGADRSSIILPISGLKQFHDMIGHFVEITKDRIESMTGPNIRTVEPAQR
ncbi:Transcription factor Pur-alpha 1 [Nymphaea thermarum]|nr:Transcription factor Pur-alpha 1 [Nymphaea thermarum]